MRRVIHNNPYFCTGRFDIIVWFDVIIRSDNPRRCRGFIFSRNMHRKLLVTEMGRLNAEEYRRAEKLPLVVVLDNVRSLHNVGAVFRTADAFRLEGLCLCGITAVPPHPELHKTALGAEDCVEWRYYPTTLEAVQVLHDAGFMVLSLEQAEGSTRLERLALEPGRHYAIVVGHEVHGVSQDVVDASDGCLEIPQFGTKHSLNVSVAAGIAIWQAYLQLASAH